MRPSCTLAVGALAVAAVGRTCAFHLTAPVPSSGVTCSSFRTATAVSPRVLPSSRSSRSRDSRHAVLQASLGVPGMDWVRGRAERAKSVLALDSAAAADSVAAAPVEEKKGASVVKVGFYLFVWYTLTIGYNIYNKATLNRIRIPWILSSVQLAIGSVYVSMIWLTGLRKAPKLSLGNMKAIAPLALLHTTAHIAAVVALSAGAIGFVQIVKVCLSVCV